MFNISDTFLIHVFNYILQYQWLYYIGTIVLIKRIFFQPNQFQYLYEKQDNVMLFAIGSVKVLNWKFPLILIFNFVVSNEIDFKRSPLIHA
jgi:hypothetical protein